HAAGRPCALELGYRRGAAGGRAGGGARGAERVAPGKREELIMEICADGYLRFLVERDGEPDLGRRAPARRGAFVAAIDAEPLRATMSLDRAAYLRNLNRRRPEDGLDARILWLLATAQANQAERFGVGLAELYGLVTPESDRVRLHVTLQEVYHTRILGDVLALFGLPLRH